MTKILIQGMTCGHCEKAVASALARVPGVLEVKSVSHTEGHATVEGTADPRALIDAVLEEGYEAVVAP